MKKKIRQKWERVPRWIKDAIGLAGLLYALYVMGQILGMAQQQRGGW
jgi:hypothetical protein